jgi:predicted HTH domain antitoxin
MDIHELTASPSEALRKAHDGPIAVLEGDHLEAILMHLDLFDQPGEPDGMTLALAVALYKDGAMSLGRAARVASVSVSDMASHLSRLGIPIAGNDPGEGQPDMETLREWLASS